MLFSNYSEPWQGSMISIRISPVVPYFYLGLPRVGIFGLGWGFLALSLAAGVSHWYCREWITMVSQCLNTSVTSLTHIINSSSWLVWGQAFLCTLYPASVLELLCDAGAVILMPFTS